MDQSIQKDEIALHCVWPDYQPIRAEMDVDPLIISTLQSAKDKFARYGISRVMLINDVIYPFNNLARDVLKFESAEIQKLSEGDKQDFFAHVEAMAGQLALDPTAPSQAVQWNNDIYILTSTRAAVLKNTKRVS